MLPTRPQPATGTRRCCPLLFHRLPAALAAVAARGCALLVASARVLAAGALFIAVGVAGLAPASAATSHTWILTGWNIHKLYGVNPALAQYFFNTPSSYGTGPQPATDPVKDGFATTPVLWYASYQQFASDVHSGVITYPYQWVMYDPEHSSRTPLKEQQDPGTYLRLFAQLAHAHGYKVIESPARVLGLAAGAVCPLEQGETLNDWYLRCDLPGLAAAYSDIVLIQDQANMKHVSAYAPFFNSAQQEALA